MNVLVKLSLVSALLFIACKKDRTCNCSTSDTQTVTTTKKSPEVKDFNLNVIKIAENESNSVVTGTNGTDKVSYTKIKKNKMSELCPASSENSNTEVYSTTTNTYIVAGIFSDYYYYQEQTTVSTTVSHKISCKIE